VACRRYLMHYIDIGMDVHGEKPPVIGGQIVLSPGRLCMRRMGLLTEAKLAEEAARYGKEGSRPQVVWPNGVLASIAVGLGVELAVGRAEFFLTLTLSMTETKHSNRKQNAAKSAGHGLSALLQLILVIPILLNSRHAWKECFFDYALLQVLYLLADIFISECCPWSDCPGMGHRQIRRRAWIRAPRLPVCNRVGPNLQLTCNDSK
jgi:hypothetical protein